MSMDGSRHQIVQNIQFLVGSRPKKWVSESKVSLYGTMLEIKKKCSLNITLLNVLPYEL